MFFQVTIDSWQWVMLVGAAPALLVLFISHSVPESTQWQASMAKDGHSNPLKEIFGATLRRNTFLAIIFASVALIVTWGIVQWIPLWAWRNAARA
jgi:MFS transporter, SHS family, sialic acid transporter